MSIKRIENLYRLDTTEMIEKLGYTTPKKPKIGNVGKALMEASKENKDCKWAKEQLDTMFSKLRKEEKTQKKGKKTNGKRKK